MRLGRLVAVLWTVLVVAGAAGGAGEKTLPAGKSAAATTSAPPAESALPPAQPRVEVAVVEQPTAGCRQAAAGSRVRVKFVMLVNGVVTDTSQRDTPMEYTLQREAEAETAAQMEQRLLSQWEDSPQRLRRPGSLLLVPGWDLGLHGACAGEKRKVVVPPELGFGKHGQPPQIPPNATLTFYLEVVDVQPPEDPDAAADASGGRLARTLGLLRGWHWELLGGLVLTVVLASVLAVWCRAPASGAHAKREAARRARQRRG